MQIFCARIDARTGLRRPNLTARRLSAIKLSCYILWRVLYYSRAECIAVSVSSVYVIEILKSG